MEKLLTRDEFRELGFARDNHKCVVCGAPGQDFHHILDRRLFTDGGYYLSNGATVCGACHIKCEQTIISVEELRSLCGIVKPVIASHLYLDQPYDKWANPILPNGRRLKGELFHDESVQKILKSGGVLDLFTDYVKYPRTYHVDFSPGVGKDDRVIDSYDSFVDKEVIVTQKMDGENSSAYCDYLHARSLDYSPHPSRDRLKAFHAQIAHDIPKGWRLVIENCYAKHSIEYSNLENYFYLISVWNEQNECLSWDDTVEYAALFGLPIVPLLYRGPFDLKLLKTIHSPRRNEDDCEGWVMRLADKFHYKDFRKFAAKYVRAGHVQHDNSHWRRGIITENRLKPISEG